MCVHLYISVCKLCCVGLWSLEEGTESPADGDTGGCDLTWVLGTILGLSRRAVSALSPYSTIFKDLLCVPNI